MRNDRPTLQIAVLASCLVALAGCASGPSPRPEAAALDANETAAVAKLTALATANGEPSPKDIQVVETNEAAAMKALFDSSGDASRAANSVVALTATGNFTAHSAKMPPGADLPTGNVLTMIFDNATGQISDWGVTSTLPALSPLGPVLTAKPS